MTDLPEGDRAWLLRIAALVSNSPLLVFERDGRKNFTRITQRRRALLAGIITDAAQDPQKETNDEQR